MAEGDAFFEARDFLLAHRGDYAQAYQEFRWPKLERFNWALDVFDAIARDNRQPALVVADEDGGVEKVSFAELAARSNQAANFLRRHGVVRGGRILLMLDNVTPLWEIMLGAIKLGAVMIPTTSLLTGWDLEDRLERGRVSHVVAGPGVAARFARTVVTGIAVGGSATGWIDYGEAAGEPESFEPDGTTRADDTLLLYFTSGTTSRPKLVEHSHASYPVGHLSTMYWIGVRAGDLHWNISSPGWAKHAWSSFFAPWNAGAGVFVLRYGRFRAETALRALGEHGITTLCAPPTVWRLLVQQDLKQWPVGVREAVAAGEPLNPEVIERVRAAWGITVRDGYGQTETTAMVGNSPGQPVTPGSMGRPLPGYRIALLDAGGGETDDGEIAVALDPRPTGLMRGYRDDPAREQEAMRGGFYRTGDRAVRGADGSITFVGRSDDVFKSSDYRISPFELESVLIEHEAVLEAAVVPTPDPVRLVVPKAYVTLREGVEPSADIARAILAFVRERVSPFKRVRRIEFGELPKTVSGKIRRVELRLAETARPADERAPGEYREEDLGLE
jgi:acetyl-CoA synthetase